MGSKQSSMWQAWLLGPLLLAGAHGALAQQVVDKAGLIADAAGAAQTVPTEQTFTITQAGSYTVTLTDLTTPAPLAALSVAVASSTATVAVLSTTGSASPTATQTITLQPGTYFEQVLATAAMSSPYDAGSYSVKVTAPGGAAVPVAPVGGSGSADAFVGTVGAPNGSTPGQTVLQTSFPVTNAGNYQLTLTDLNFPAPLASGAFSVALWNQADSTMLLVNQSNIGPGTIGIPSLPTGTYELIVVAQAESPALQGLFSVQIEGGSSGASVVLATTQSVGSLPPPIQFTVPAGMLTVDLQDLATPAALSNLQAVLVEGASVLQPASGAGSYNLSAVTAGVVLLYVNAVAGSSGEGAWVATATGGSQKLLDIAQTVSDSTHYGFVFPLTLSTASGYQLQLKDFQIPGALSTLAVSAEQSGSLLGGSSLATGGSVTLSPEPVGGSLNLIAFATPGSNGSGLFGVQLTSGSTMVYQGTQALGPGFQAQTVSVPAAGNYEVQFTDLGFPASFKQLALILTNGNTIAGQISTAGTFTQSLQPGQYVLNILAQTGSTSSGSAANYGLYGVQIDASPDSGSGSGSSSSGSTPKSGGGGALSPLLLAALALLLVCRRRERGGRAAGR